MSDTPRTDSYVYKFPGCQREPRLIDFARKLERELAEARADFRLAKNIIETHVERVAERDKLIEQTRDALRLADDLIDEYAEIVEHRDNVDEVREQIKAALEATERP